MYLPNTYQSQFPAVTDTQPRPWIKQNLEYVVFHDGKRQTKTVDARTGQSNYR